MLLLITILITLIVFILFIYLLYLKLKKHPTQIKEARKDTLQKSHSSVTGKVNENLAPLFPEFGDYNLRDARFLGSPIDFVIFDGLDSGTDCKVVFIEVKTGKSSLTARERRIRDAIKSGQVEWKLIRLDKISDSNIIEKETE